MASRNVARVTLSDGRIVLLSYTQPVAVYDSRTARVTVESRYYSRTTTRHINAFARDYGAQIQTVGAVEFRAAVAPFRVQDDPFGASAELSLS